MRNLSTILSTRRISNSAPRKIVYEWEDILSKEMGLPIIEKSPFSVKFQRFIKKIGLLEFYHRCLPKRNIQLAFITHDSYPIKLCENNKNTIPVIIDCWISEDDVNDYVESFKHVPLLLLTNKEVFDLLEKHNCPIPIAHWPLSFPDKYAFNRDVNYEKKYEFGLYGRIDPFFLRLVEEYVSKHPDFTFIVSRGDHNHREFFTNKGQFICKDTCREDYLNMIRSTKITCYTTPGMDEAKKETNAYNQVTPRVFEMLCNGCFVIGHYPEASDTLWYNLPSIVPNVNNYAEFESVLDRMRNNDADVDLIRHFMEKHYTSARIPMLTDILLKHDIVIK